MIIFVLALIAVLVFIIIQFVNAKGVPRQVVQMLSGTIGAGKTYVGCSRAIRQYKKIDRWYRHRKRPLNKLLGHTSDRPPRLYSNIPVFISKKARWSYVLKREHLLMQETFDRDYVPVVLWDEVGMSCSQYSYDDPNVVSDNLQDRLDCVETFIRLFRHFYGEGNHDSARLICTDQASGDVCIALRRRFGMIDFLSDFHRWLFVTPFYKVTCRQLLLAEDQVTNVNNTMKQEDESCDYYFGILPFKWMKRMHYDSHAYSGLAVPGSKALGSLAFDRWSDNNYGYLDGNTIIFSKYKTNYVPDLRMTYEEKRAYKEKIKGISRSHGNRAGIQSERTASPAPLW